MPYSRWLALLRVFVIGVLAGLPLACAQVVTNTAQLEVAGALVCPVGSQGCACTPGGGCDPGLVCSGGTCVGGGGGGYGGDAGYEEYNFEDDMLEAEILAPAPAAEPMRAM